MIRIPKRRGFKNKSLVTKPQVISLESLNKITFSEITIDALHKAGLISKTHKGGVKILGDGELTVSLIVELPVSKRAQLKIEKAGGTVINQKSSQANKQSVKQKQ